jgi:hypothetical protein
VAVLRGGGAVVSEERRGGARDREEVLAHPLQGVGGRGRGAQDGARRGRWRRPLMAAVAALWRGRRGREARVSEKSSRRAMGCAFIGQGGGGEATAGVMAINGHGGRP